MITITHFRLFKHLALVLAGVALGIFVDSSDWLRSDTPNQSDHHRDNTGTAERSQLVDADTHRSSAGAPGILASDNNSTEGALYQKIAFLNTENATEIAADILRMPESSHHRLAALDLLMQQWARIDPEGALTFANSLHGSDNDEAFRSALLHLGAENYDLALNWMHQKMTHSTRQNAQIWLYTGLSRQDPQRAMQTINDLPYGKLKEDALTTVASDWAERDVYAAFDWYETAPWNGSMASVYKQLMGQYMKQYPEDAMSLVEQMDDGYWKNQYQQDLIRQLAATEPHAALEVAQGLTDQNQQASSINAIFQEWSSSNPELALQAAYTLSEAPQHDEVLLNDVFRNAAFGVHWQDPAAIRQQYDQLPRNIRHEIVGPMVEQWLQEDPSHAEEWIVNRPKDGIEYNLGMSSMAHYYEDWAPERAIQTANQIEYDDIRTSAVFSALRKMYHQDPTKASHFSKNRDQVTVEQQASFTKWVSEMSQDSMVYLIPSP